jgi:predicted alpha/beta superfamily hydrolase
VFNIEKQGLGYKLVYVIDGGSSNDIASSIDVM